MTRIEYIPIFGTPILGTPGSIRSYTGLESHSRQGQMAATGNQPESSSSKNSHPGFHKSEPLASEHQNISGSTQQAGENPPIAAIIPAFNEALVIGSVVLQAQQHVDCVIVVDDGSADKTADIARLAGADVVVLPENAGKAHAMMVGFDRAKALGYDVVVMLDGDGQHNPNEIPAVVAPVLAGVADLVIGSRFLERDESGEIPAYRIAGQKVLNGFTSFASGYSCSDSQSGFRALGRRALENLTFTSEGYDIESDMISHFAHIGLTMAEVPISVTYDVPNKHKKNPLSHGLGVLGKLVGVIGYRRPLLSFGVPGVIFAIIGFALEVFTFSQYVRYHQFHFILFTAGLSFLILGLLAMMCGLILNSLVIIMKEHRHTN